MPCERGHGGEDSGDVLAVAVGVDGVGHGVVGVDVGEERGGLGDDGVFVGVDEFDGAVADSLGALGGVTHDKHGLAQGGGFLLHSAGIGDHKLGAVHEGAELVVGQWGGD